MSYCVTYFNFALFPLKGWGGFATHNSLKYKFKSDQSVEIWNCNCSICDMINYQHLFVKHELFELISGEDLLLEYKFESGSAKHFFCKRCGIKSFYQPRSHPEMYSINLKCVDDPPEIKEIIYFDGINFEESIKNIWMFIYYCFLQFCLKYFFSWLL